MAELSHFIEEQAILAAQEEDHDELQRLIGLLLPGERELLRLGAQTLSDALEAWEDEGGS